MTAQRRSTTTDGLTIESCAVDTAGRDRQGQRLQAKCCREQQDIGRVQQAVMVHVGQHGLTRIRRFQFHCGHSSGNGHLRVTSRTDQSGVEHQQCSQGYTAPDRDEIL